MTEMNFKTRFREKKWNSRFREFHFLLGYKDSNLENDGVRVRCLTIWR